MSTYKYAARVPSQFSADDDRVLLIAVESGETYQDIKNNMFANRFDLTPQILEARVRRLRDPPPGGSSQIQGQQVHGSQAYMPQEPASFRNHQPLIPSSPQAWPTSQGLAYPSPLAPQPVLHNTSAGQEQGGGAVQVASRCGLRMTSEEFEEIKIELAQGFKMEEIAANRPGRTRTGLTQAIRRRGYKHWSFEQDNYLELHGESRDNLAEIIRNFPAPERNVQEVQARLRYLIEQRGKKSKKAKHQFSPADDLYIRLQSAQGKRWKDMNMERFPNVDPRAVARHAREIDATWSEADDQKLSKLFLEYENPLEVDWYTIGQEYEPPRSAVVVEKRSKWLRGLL